MRISIRGIALVLMSTPAVADDGDAWLAGALRRPGRRASRNGEPSRDQAHVPLCDNRVLPCGNKRIGDGDRARRRTCTGAPTAASSAGSARARLRLAAGRAIESIAAHRDNVLDAARLAAPRRGRRAHGSARGVTTPIDVYIVACAWRGIAIDAGLAAYLDDRLRRRRAHDRARRRHRLAAGGSSRSSRGSGTTALMDVAPIDWPRAPPTRRPARAA